MSQSLPALLSTLFLGACSIVGIREGTEEPRYTVVQTVGRVEIRQYGQRLAAETEIDADEMASRREGFERLAAYIFGKNHANADIAMTAPVAQASAQRSQNIAMTAPVSQTRDAAGRWRVRFYMPAKYTEATLPRPLDPRVEIVTVPPETVAVWRYSGARDPEAVARAGRELLAGLEGSGWAPVGAPVAWFYDPPWTIPPLRRNEAAVVVTRP
jgi:hypothetical protein